MDSHFYAQLTLIAFVLVLVLAFVASIFVRRMERRAPTPISEEIGSTKAVMRKLRKREPMSADEVDFARRVIGDRTSPMAFCIPGALFMLGCFYVLGSLEHLHGARPSERTFLGLIPMLTSTNLAIRLLASTKLKRRLPKPAPAPVPAGR